jgi:hypothetical protein
MGLGQGFACAQGLFLLWDGWRAGAWVGLAGWMHSFQRGTRADLHAYRVAVRFSIRPGLRLAFAFNAVSFGLVY